MREQTKFPMGVSRDFSPDKEVRCDLAEIRFEVLDKLMEEAAACYGEMMKKKEARSHSKVSIVPGKKRRIEDKLRSTDPW
jgi:hypothetical protein